VLDVADSLVNAAKRLAPGQVRVVLDASAKVARVGYGDFDAVKRLAVAGIDIRQHDGLRLGVLICDDHGWAFASAARYVEADPTADTEAFNAIALTTAQVLALRAELPPLGLSSPAEQLTPVVGEDPVTKEELAKVEAALKIAPPQSFDLARQTQVYSALIQFVELSFEGFNIQSRRVELPRTLPLLATNDENLKARVTASLKLLNKVEPPKALTEIKLALEDLRKRYLKPVGDAGRVIRKKDVPSFEKELERIQKAIDECKQSLTDELQKTLDQVIASITNEMAPAIRAAPPFQFRIGYNNTDADAKDFVREELRRCLPTATKLVEGMSVHKHYKDVTYETLKNNKEFQNRVKEQIPEAIVDGVLLDEVTAAKATNG
jgi:hypothetical protein